MSPRCVSTVMGSTDLFKTAASRGRIDQRRCDFSWRWQAMGSLWVQTNERVYFMSLLVAQLT